MPRLWTQTIEAHKREVRDTILDATARLVAERGLLGVTMSDIAQAGGIGRATLYKYFPDVEAILHAWHERAIARHLEQLESARDAADGATARLRAVLEAYALIARESHGHRDADLAAFLHRDEHVDRAQHRLNRLLGELLGDAIDAGEVRADVSPEELVAYCLHALAAARGLRSKVAVRRLVDVVLDGLRPSAP